MKRRSFLKRAGSGLVAGAFAAPAIAQSQPAIRWRLASSFPKSLDTLFGNAELIADRVNKLTDGKFQIRTFAGGEIVPPLQVLDAVQQGTVECGQTASYYYVGKNKAFAFDTTLPFGMTARQQNAWMYHGGGLQLLRDFFREYGVIQFPCGNTGTQMGGWFRNEIKSLANVKGLKMRIPGIGGEIMARLGAVPQTLAGADIYPALERGTIDATEWVGPYDDEKLGFHKVAKFYYYPGWWEGCAQLTFLVNIKEWGKLPKEFQAALETVCAEANVKMMADYDVKNPAGLQKLLNAGVQLRSFPQDMMRAAYKAAFELYEEEAKTNAAFGKIYPAWKRFLGDQQAWARISELAFSNFTTGEARARADSGKKSK
jgi:TRAP-type mannitol/chloroaromatic compound transport system substrate-binding protein